MKSAESEAGATERFKDTFGSEPIGIWQAPGRVNLIGEHTDYNDGFALPFAISSNVSVAAAPRDDDLLVLTSCQEGTEAVEVPLTVLIPGAVAGWAAYPAGVAWSLRGAGYPVRGLNVAIDADLALGAGLSSSAALECAVALAMLDLNGIELPRTELARLARRAENDFVGAPTGIMDQIAVLLSQEGHALLLDCRTAATTQVPFDPAGAGLVLMIINTRARHELTDGGYASRRLRGSGPRPGCPRPPRHRQRRRARPTHRSASAPPSQAHSHRRHPSPADSRPPQVQRPSQHRPNPDRLARFIARRLRNLLARSRRCRRRRNGSRRPRRKDGRRRLRRLSYSPAPASESGGSSRSGRRSLRPEWLDHPKFHHCHPLGQCQPSSLTPPGSNGGEQVPCSA